MSVGILLWLTVASMAPTDFGVRTVGVPVPRATTASITVPSAAVSQPFSLTAATAIARGYGRVTSTIRSAERNRRVGGVANSWHLHGRAIDIARAPTISHAAIAAEFRRRGFHLIESLDEGDHSHFAFSDRPVGTRARSRADQFAEVRGEAAYFRFVEMPRANRADQRSALR